ncbi:MAG: putative sulfate exporter family transporter [Amaricoccus sp.]|uniref:YeiH family protein n=1 Tax=Amaricoccus sp. TaxID=1872485 RepID=UPI0039E652E3
MTHATSLPDSRVRRLGGTVRRLAPGVLACGVIALAAQFLSDHYGAPTLLLALLLGIAFQFLSEEGAAVPGIAFTGKTVLRLGVALLGARMSFELLLGVGLDTIALVVLAVAATIGFALLTARVLGRGWRIALLTGGAVAICGASAAMAIAAVLPRNEHSERNLIFTVISVMLLSTTAMVAYPIICAALGFDDKATGIFLGATIHDVAQVVGAGFSVSDTAGEAATLVKLFRVTLLAPVVLVYSLSIRHWVPGEGVGEARPPLLPGFVVGFILLAIANSVGLVPAPAAAFMVDASRWALVLGIAAVGMKTSMRSIREVGVTAIALVVAETLFLAVFILGGLELLGHGGH